MNGNWQAPSADSLLVRLDGATVAGSEANLVLRVGQRTRMGPVPFAIGLRRANGVVGRQSALLGAYHSGAATLYNWVEVAHSAERVDFADGVTLPFAGTAAEVVVLRLLAGVLPPGGQLMIEYESDHRRESREALTRGVPPIATPLGRLLFDVGCGFGFKDWYFAEGGLEGPRKLQGGIARDETHAIRAMQMMVAELEAFLGGRARQDDRAAAEVALAELRAWLASRPLNPMQHR